MKKRATKRGFGNLARNGLTSQTKTSSEIEARTYIQWAACRDKKLPNLRPRGRFFLDFNFYRTGSSSIVQVGGPHLKLRRART